MLRIRRHDLAPRVEMTPLIDVIFLLLTFFIYSLIMMRPFEVLPVTLATVDTGEQAEETQVVAITMDRRGRFYVNRAPVADEALDTRLLELAGQTPPPRIIVAMEVEVPAGDEVVDRGPRLLELVQRLYKAGITDYEFAGPPLSP